MYVERRVQDQQGGIRNRPRNNCENPRRAARKQSSEAEVEFEVKVVFEFFQGCHTLRELRETQGILNLKKISGNSGKLREFSI